MPKVIDSFLFFQELDLLEIRLRYLYDVVDHFVILEAAQAFSGKEKEFVFEQNADRFSPFADKIHYFKLDEVHHSFDEVCDALRRKSDATSSRILRILETQSHFDQGALHWVLDEYHRECLAYPLSKLAHPGDLVFFSDLDEIPAHDGIERAMHVAGPDRLSVLVCDEFDYFVNWFKFRGWFGPISGRWEAVQTHSLNDLRRLVRGEARSFNGDGIARGGYHFTSCGGLVALKSKIESWGHQEFNIGLVKARLETNMRYGRDVFFRGGDALKYVDVHDAGYFDPALSAILEDYPNLIAAAPEQENFWSSMRYLLDRGHYKLLRLGQKLSGSA